MSTPKYRLVYYDVRALGEPIRWIFHYTGTPFVDERIPWDYPTWFAEIKQKFASTNGQIPVLHEEGQPELCQSHVISRYLATKFDLVADSARDNATLDELISMVFDLFFVWRTLIMFEKDPERKKFNRQKVDEKFKLAYTKWNKRLEESGGDYVIGKKLTHADFWLASFVSIWDDPMKGDRPIMPTGFPEPSEDDIYIDYTKNFPALRAHKQRIHEIPQIKEWVARRHQTIA